VMKGTTLDKHLLLPCIAWLKRGVSKVYSSILTP
jgi:hypothetical protein